MSVSVARVPTGSASRYLQQLAKHWSHKMTVTFSEEEGRIAFPNGSVLEMRADTATLDVILTVPEGRTRRGCARWWRATSTASPFARRR